MAILARNGAKMGENIDDERTPVGKKEGGIYIHHRILKPGVFHILDVIQKSHQTVQDDDPQTRSDDQAETPVTQQPKQDQLTRHKQSEDEQQPFAATALPGKRKSQQQKRCFNQAVADAQLPDESMAAFRAGRKPDLHKIVQSIQQPINTQDPPGANHAHIFPEEEQEWDEAKDDSPVGDNSIEHGIKTCFQRTVAFLAFPPI
jgi:hypothetical protein